MLFDVTASFHDICLVWWTSDWLQGKLDPITALCGLMAVLLCPMSSKFNDTILPKGNTNYSSPIGAALGFASQPSPTSQPATAHALQQFQSPFHGSTPNIPLPSDRTWIAGHDTASMPKSNPSALQCTPLAVPGAVHQPAHSPTTRIQAGKVPHACSSTYSINSMPIGSRKWQPMRQCRG